MQRDETIRLDGKPVWTKGLRDFLEPYLDGSTVLNVGAAGNVEYYLDGRRDEWLHAWLGARVSELVGLDIDEESVAHANERGEDLLCGDCESIQLGRKFDLIVFSEVIEHVASPVRALDNLLAHLAPEGRIVLTTPNPTYYATLIRSVLNSDLGIYYDHVSAFFPENIVVACHRLGARVRLVRFFNTYDQRSLGLRLKSRLAAFIGRFLPRLSSNFILVIEPVR